jgi:glycosyltransferase involved in cell wall biosynthesis
MHIGMLTSSYPRFAGDGAGTFVRSLAEAYAAENHSVTVIAPHDARAQKSLGAANVVRFRYAPDRLSVMGHARALRSDRDLKWFVPFCVPFYYAAAIRALNAAHQQRAFDWIHVQWILPSGPIGAHYSLRHRLPFVLTLQGSDVYLAERFRPLAWIARYTLRAAALTAGVSEDLRIRALRIGLPYANSTVIPNGVDPDLFKPDVALGKEIRVRLNLLPDTPVILAVGRLVYKKGFDILLRAMPNILRAHPSAVLLIAGDGDLNEMLAELVDRLRLSHAVRFLGHIPWLDLPGLMNAADLCVFPYVRDQSGNVDGMPTAAIEAMACGRPVVASRLTGLEELISDRHTGWLVSPGVPCELAQAISTLLNDTSQQERIGANAREQVTRNYSWRVIARRYIDFAQSHGWAQS